MKNIMLTVFVMMIGLSFTAQVFACPLHGGKKSADSAVPAAPVAP